MPLVLAVDPARSGRLVFLLQVLALLGNRRLAGLALLALPSPGRAGGRIGARVVDPTLPVQKITRDYVGLLALAAAPGTRGSGAGMVSVGRTQ